MATADELFNAALGLMYGSDLFHIESGGTGEFCGDGLFLCGDGGGVRGTSVRLQAF